MSNRNRQTSRRWFEEVWNARDSESAGAMMASGAVGHTEAGETVGLADFLAFRDRFLDAFPDLMIDVESVVADGDETAVRWVARGTHSGDALGVPACHRPIEVRGMTWHRYEDGVLAEGWDSWNLGALMQHLTAESGPETGTEADDREPGDEKTGPPPSRLARRAKIAARLREVRLEVFGEHGGPEVARRLNLPARAWYNYETGVTVPADVLHDFADLSGAEPRWLITGEGPRYQEGRAPECGDGS
jgi:steroid delta-isomerase-like uncharacterized protein